MPSCAACSKVTPNSVSGPAAPPVDWAKLGFKFSHEGSAAGGRHLLDGGGRHHPFCVPCGDKKANAQGTACE
jgi:hypothetical protein